MTRTTLRLELMELRLNPAIRLDLVALHEFGHALGLNHSNDTSSITYAYYNANYNLNNFSSDSAVTTFRNLFANVATSSWKDSLDSTPGNGRVDLTYSFMPDGARMDKGSSNLFTTFDKIAPRASWQAAFADQLTRWASVSNGKVAFTQRADAGLNFNFSGAAQNDSRAGDIRIGGHRFDGSGKVLAHTYFPPPNGSTAAGDAHYDSSESWVLSGSGGLSTPPGNGNGNGGGPGNLMAWGCGEDEDHDHGLSHENASFPTETLAVFLAPDAVDPAEAALPAAATMTSKFRADELVATVAGTVDSTDVPAAMAAFADELPDLLGVSLDESFL